MKRREFIKALSCLAAASYAAPSMALGREYYSKPGLQLFTVMKLLDADFSGTLQKVSEIGYRKVETMGSFNLEPTQLKAQLDEFGLKTYSQHLMPGNLYESFSKYNRGLISWDEIIKIFIAAFDFNRVDAFVSEAIERAQVLGQKYIVWQLNWQESYGLAEVKQHIKAFHLAGELCAQAGMKFALHNHNHEFAPLDNSTAYDLMVQETNPDHVKLQMDFMWASFAGVDPVKYLERYPTRYRLVHLKDHDKKGKIVLPGHGVEDFGRLLKASQIAGVEHAYFEFDQPVKPLEEITQAYDFLSKVPRR
ncbi:sugar phosphate isomerase/epimerase [Aestuariibacter sp. GS-14]|uniref:sugar phosphate isomerase/epimerase family protein n=1 Tax=Aestuariibacter sp. GS-14 TaxID=2590670 RepID=UPI00112CE908|nr:sugar phosphate isomerase/epimerase [Aestuariibacter sp. GS-14]TPV61797.1 sugar phosphate isomerase/epimerase [Aestuariibacter sp. GS-14]